MERGAAPQHRSCSSRAGRTRPRCASSYPEPGLPCTTHSSRSSPGACGGTAPACSRPTPAYRPPRWHWLCGRRRTIWSSCSSSARRPPTTPGRATWPSPAAGATPGRRPRWRRRCARRARRWASTCDASGRPARAGWTTCSPRSGAPPDRRSPRTSSPCLRAPRRGSTTRWSWRVWVPLRHLGAPGAATEYLHALASGEALRFPAIGYREHVIWGLTYRILSQFLEIARTPAQRGRRSEREESADPRLRLRRAGARPRAAPRTGVRGARHHPHPRSGSRRSRRRGPRPPSPRALEPASLRAPASSGGPTWSSTSSGPSASASDRYTAWGTREHRRAPSPSAPLEALVYLSSTSVYGRRSGEWTDETHADRPQLAPRARRAAGSGAASTSTSSREPGLPARICRVPGIYGPGRTLRRAPRDAAPTAGWTTSGSGSRASTWRTWCAGSIAAWRRGTRRRDLPPLRRRAGHRRRSTPSSPPRLLSLPLPPTVEREDIRQELNTSAFERRISRATLQQPPHARGAAASSLAYPSVREGLPAALRDEGAI